MQQLENQLNDLFTRRFPYQLPDKFRGVLVKITPWLTLAGGAFSLLAVIGLYNTAVFVDRISTYLYNTYPYTYAPSVNISPIIWISLLIVLVQAVIFFAAFPSLRVRKKHGWNLLYWVSLLNVAYGVSYLFVGYNVGSFVGSLLSSAVGLYFLFEIRSYFTDAGIPNVQPKSSTPTTTIPEPPAKA